MSRFQGQILEVTVVGCSRLKNTEWISRQDPYVCLEYANNKFRTRTCTDGGREPSFKDKFILTLIEGLPEMNVSVWNSNTFTRDDLIALGRVNLQEALSEGFDDRSWPLQTSSGRSAGEIRLLLTFKDHQMPKKNPAEYSGNIATHLNNNPSPFPPPPPTPHHNLQAYAPPPPSPYQHLQTYPPPPSPYHHLQTYAYPPNGYTAPPHACITPPQPYVCPPPQQPYYPTMSGYQSGYYRQPPY